MISLTNMASNLLQTVKLAFFFFCLIGCQVSLLITDVLEFKTKETKNELRVDISFISICYHLFLLAFIITEHFNIIPVLQDRPVFLLGP